MRQALLSRWLHLQTRNKALYPCPCWLLRAVDQRDIIQLRHSLPGGHVQPLRWQLLCVSVPRLPGGNVLLGSCIHQYAICPRTHSPFGGSFHLFVTFLPSVCSLYRVPAGLLLPLLRHGQAYPVSVDARLPARKLPLSFRHSPLVLWPPPAPPPPPSHHLVQLPATHVTRCSRLHKGTF